MSVIGHQVTCVACGRPISETDNVSIEPLVDESIRYVAVHWDCHTFVYHDRKGDNKEQQQQQLTEPE